MPRPDVEIVDLRLTVTADRHVRLDSVFLNETGRIDETHLQDPLAQWTITTLIRWLQEKRLDKHDDIRLLGAHLHHALLGNNIGRILHEHRNKENEFLSIELFFENSKDDMADWPWEYLYCLPAGEAVGYYIANEAQFAITRRPSGQPARPIQVKEKPVRALFVAVSPCDLGPIDFNGLRTEIETLQWVDPREHEKGRRFELLEPLLTEYVDEKDVPYRKETGTLRSKATWEGFQQMLVDLARADRSPHIIHFVGHGKSENGQGWVAFAEDNCHSRWVSDGDLAGALQPYKTLKLVFLQACESALATPDVYAPYQALSTVARCLAGVAIPAVVAMQSKVDVATANNFARTFYDSLVRMMPVYQAVQEGRRSISKEEGALGIPVLYLLRYSNEVGVLFPVIDQPAAPVGSIGTSSTAPGRIRCAWCGEGSTPGRKCSKCRSFLRCPKCGSSVQVEAGNRLDKDEWYECKNENCDAAFKWDGTLEGQVAAPLAPDGFGERPSAGGKL
jgi:hypothetical protein